MNDAAQKELSYSQFWDERYKAESFEQDGLSEEYEWFKTFEKLRPFLTKHLKNVPTDTRMLHLGCGKSVGWLIPS